MKKAFTLIVAVAALFGATAQNSGNKPVLKDYFDSASYAIGRDVFYGMTQQWDKQNLPINKQIAFQAMMDCLNGNDTWTDQMAMPLLQRFQQAFEERQRGEIQKNIDAGAKYMEEIANNKSVYSTQSGLKYKIVKKGNGKKPSLHKGEQGKTPDKVKVHYTGKLIDGKIFDSSIQRGNPITFQLDQVIPGWTEGLQLMDEGSTYMLYIPYNLGYGEHATGDIPAGSTLVFEVQLLEINPK